jgi:acyl-coenzyme A synthetase/AMP-(fatty) acid ligase
MTLTGTARPFLAAREFLLDQRENLAAANADFKWPALDEFNWALDYFDTLSPEATALWLLNPDGTEERRSFGELSERSNRVANYLRDLGVGRGDRILLVLGNSVPLWETMLAAMKLGAVLIPATTLLTSDDLRDRIERGQVKVVVTASDLAGRFEGIPGGQVGASFLTVRREPQMHCCCISLRAPPPSQSSSSIRMPAIRWATSRRCTGSASAPATSTSTSPPPAGPSTPGAASSHHGTPPPASWCSTTRASTRPPCWTRSSGAR